jgi:SAM-dependent methyltransferase
MCDRFHWARLLAFVTGLVNQELLLRNEYWIAENRILRSKLPNRLLLSDPDRAVLGEIAKRPGRRALRDIARVARPDTILGWYRRLMAQKFDGRTLCSRSRSGQTSTGPAFVYPRTLYWKFKRRWKMNIIERMREDWNRRAIQDANYYVAFAREKQPEEEFLSTAAEVVSRLESEFHRLPSAPKESRRALEIGCGPGRLLIPMSRHFGEIHGVDISDEMVAMARPKLARIPHAQAHVNSGSDLAIFGDSYFDFVYSWIVFQHIPDKDVVLNYLREAQRVLKPGGILACQVRGVSAIDTELKPGMETWTGCWFSESEIAAFASTQRFPLVALSGLGTQYTVTVFRKPVGLPPSAPPDRVLLKDVTAASSGDRRTPTRGRAAAVSLWIEGFPQDGDLAQFPVLFGDRVQTGCYLSLVSESGGCQLNATLPGGIAPGIVPVRLSYRGTPVSSACQIEVFPAPPRNPKVLLVTDRVNILARNHIENDGIKITIEDLEDPAEVSFTVGGRKAGFVLVDCEDPITSTYIFGFPLPHKTKKGVNRLSVRIGDLELAPVQIDVV